MKTKKYKGTVLVLDGMNCMHRAYHPNRKLEDADGFPTGALHGVLMHIHRLKGRFPGAEIVVVWDGPEDKKGSKGWRFDLAPKIYKAHRVPSEATVRIYRQLKPLVWLLYYAGYIQMRVKGVEADDLLALYVAERRSQGYKVVIDSTDKDFYQLLGDGVTAIQTVANMMLERTWEDVYDEFGISKEQWVCYRALVGDASDGMQGLRNCGPKRAPKLLEAGVDPRRSWRYQPAMLKEKTTREHWADVRLCYTLSLLPDDLENLDPGPLANKWFAIIQSVYTVQHEPDAREFYEAARQHQLAAVLQKTHSIMNGGV